MDEPGTALPPQAVSLVAEFINGLQQIMPDNLYGIYLYGASVFPDCGPIQDIDCHVIIKHPLGEMEINAYQACLGTLAEKHPDLGDELDAYVILLKDARGLDVPQHQVYPRIHDHAWALHCAHIRAGRYRTLWGPEPTEVFPQPTWDAIDDALQFELQYVLDHPQYPAYGILNLCRILYSYKSRDPALSKQMSGRWGLAQYPRWADLIQAAMRYYRKTHTLEDISRMETHLQAFTHFMQLEIAASR